MNKIPAGYRFTFHSCDIRNENPYSIIKESLNEFQANLLFELSEAYKNSCYLQVRSLNPEWRIKKEHEDFYNIIKKYDTIFTNNEIEDMKNDVGLIIDYISENIVGYSYDDDYTMRTLLSYKIENIPEDIIINDVTTQFYKKYKR